jgi:putative transposase
VSMTKQKKKDGREPEARRLRRELFTDEMLDQLMAATDERGLSLTGEGGFLPEMIKAVLERGHGGRADRPPGV